MISFSTFNYDETNINDFLLKLSKKYPVFLQEPIRLFDIIKQFKLNSSNIITAIIENDHVDRQFRDSYYTYFSQKYSNFERNCLRLAFFVGRVTQNDFKSDDLTVSDKLIGTIVLRPLNVGTIGLTLLNPSLLDICGYVQTCRFKVMICGRKMFVKAFPFISQDDETMTCAETAVFNLIQYYSEKYSEYRLIMPSEILRIIEDSSYERVLPASGIDDRGMAKVLQTEHFHPRLYTYENEDDFAFEELFYTYVESGIPFILGLPQHAIICVGHSYVDFEINEHCLQEIVTCEEIEGNSVFFLCSEKLVDNYIFMDDNQRPYVVSSIDKLTEYYYRNGIDSYEDEKDEFPEDGLTSTTEGTRLAIQGNSEYTADAILQMKKRFDSILVPLPKRIFLDASRAKSIFDEHFLKNPDFIENIREAYSDKTWGDEVENPLLWRMYLASSNSYKDFRCRKSANDNIFKYYSSESYPRFIWVLEIGSTSTFLQRKARVEIILDATSSRNSDTWAILSVSYKGHAVFVPNIIIDHFKNSIEDVSNNITGSDSGTSSFEFIDWEEINESVKSKTLMEIFQLLYYAPVDFMPDTFDMFSNSNLKEI